MGPGSFTGLRIGMSVAKGLAFGLDIPIIPVKTFDALAMQISENIDNDENIIIANNVNMDELYFAEFKKKEEKLELVHDVQLVNKTEFEETEYLPAHRVGNYFDRPDFPEYSSPEALYVAKWAYFYGKDLLTFNYDYLEPNYLKNFIPKVKK